MTCAHTRVIRFLRHSRPGPCGPCLPPGKRRPAQEARGARGAHPPQSRHAPYVRAELGPEHLAVPRPLLQGDFSPWVFLGSPPPAPLGLSCGGRRARLAAGAPPSRALRTFAGCSCRPRGTRANLRSGSSWVWAWSRRSAQARPRGVQVERTAESP